MNNNIYAAEKSFDIGCKVVKWDEPDGFSFYKDRKFNGRNISFTELKSQINSLTFHHSATYTAQQTFNVLIERGLSVNFIIDDDCDDNGYSTIYQCADIKEGCWSQKPLNNCSIGCEISYEPIIKNGYNPEIIEKLHVQNHDLVDDCIHGKQIKVYGPSLAQVKSCIQLAWGICELFELPGLFPKEDNKTIKTAIKNPEQYRGLLFHLNITTEKIDPAGFPDQLVEQEVQKRLALGY